MVLDKSYETPPRERISQKLPRITSSKKSMIGMMFVVGLVLLIPVVLLFVSLSKEEPKSSPGQEENIFAEPYVAGELIVELKESYTAEEISNLNAAFENLGVVSQEKVFEGDDPALRNYYLLIFEEGTDIEKAREELLKIDEIRSVGPNYIFEADATPNDPLYSTLWGLQKISMPNAWEITQGAGSVTVAVVDTGIDYTHPDFSGKNFAKGYDFSSCDTYQSEVSSNCIAPKSIDDDPIDDHGHGTHVAGTIGAVANNNIGVAGVDWGVTLMAVKTMGRSSRGELADIERGVQYAIDNGADVINMSLSAGINCNDTQARSIKTVINNAIQEGIVVVVAAGNGDRNGNGIDAYYSTPASCDGVITVGAVDQNSRRTSFSNFGSLVDIAAPGLGIQSLNIGTGYSLRNGTSMAAPHVTGVVSLLLSQNPGLTPQQVRDCLVNNSDPLASQRVGPLLNAFNVLNVCSGLPPITPSPTAIPTTTATPTTTVTPSANNPAQIPYLIEGLVFIDANGNGVQDGGEIGYQGGQVTLSGEVNQTLLTDASGKFSFTNLRPGTYNLSLTINTQVIPFSQAITLSSAQNAYRATFILASAYGNQPGQNTPLPTPITQIQPLPTITRMPTPTPVATYTCRENNADYVPQGTIQLGSLICEPNN